MSSLGSALEGEGVCKGLGDGMQEEGDFFAWLSRIWLFVLLLTRFVLYRKELEKVKGQK